MGLGAGECWDSTNPSQSHSKWQSCLDSNKVSHVSATVTRKWARNCLQGKNPSCHNFGCMGALHHTDLGCVRSRRRPSSPLSPLVFFQANYRIREMDLSHNQFSDNGGELLGNMLGEWPWREGPAKERNLANYHLSGLHLLFLLLLSVLIMKVM